MRKLYALLAGVLMTLVLQARTVTPDIANFSYIVDHPNSNVVFTNTSTLGNEPGLRKAFWSFGDGSGTITPPQQGTQHHYQSAGTFTVCLKIYRYRTNLGDSVLTAQICKTVIIVSICQANFERIPSPANNPLQVYFRAQPQHNNNRKPARICWNFGDNRDTCINYPENYTGQYVASHRYNNAGQYEVCIRILYYGGCEARKCNRIEVGRPDTCAANFERIPSPANNPLQVYFRAQPQHNNNRKPARICWNFGDNRDTCINYPENYTGQYAVSHRYNHPGQYEVCVKIIYYGGCEARKCNRIEVGRPDTCAANFERIPSPASNPLLVYFKAQPQHNNNRKPARICWNFGDNRDTCINYPENYTGQYAVSHRYNHPGQYEVCVKIIYYGGCEARKCNRIEVGRPDTCRANFERIPSNANYPLLAYFKALPQHNNNRKPARICWNFGDNRDTCIDYPENYTGQYVARHNYNHPGLYEVCVKIIYYGGCEARKCERVQIGEGDNCRADFERIPSPNNNPLQVYLKALPQHNNNRKPARICWNFGDNRDTCINYPENYTGQYAVSHRYNHPGQYEVCVKIIYYGGCEARKCGPIVIPPQEVNCSVRLFEITPSITSLVRGFLAVPASTPPRRPEMICWYFGDGEDTCIIIDPQQPLPDLIIRHTYPAPGVYRACVRIRFQGGCVAEDCREVVIRPSSNVCGGYMMDSLVAPRAFKFKGFSIHNPNDQVISYRWSFGDGSTALGREVTHTYAHGGDYEVCLVIRTRLGCETRICKTVRVPGNNQPALHLTPNPVLNILHAEFLSTHTETVSIKILNGTGNVIRNYSRNVTVGPNQWDFDLASLMPGVYSFVIQSPNQLASALFIKQ
ncbi:MAG: PKD domain-containing protein [Chitinophagaceae bacterium]|nr:PKD domain-containing protein [Chitinophagaceae bacterium]